MQEPSPKPGLLVSHTSSGYTIYDPAEKRLHELNPTAALLFELCNGRRTPEEIAKIASQVVPGDSTAATKDWIDRAAQEGLLIPTTEAAQFPAQDRSADELARMAEELRDDGLVQAAFLCRERAVALAPDDPDQLRELGEVCHILGKRDAARDAYERYLALVPDDAEVRHLMTPLRNEQAPARMPDESVRQLYDRFAGFYDANMCDELGYEAPQHLRAAIDEALDERSDLTILDLGCGTGLSGLALRDRARRLVGVDLSPEMIALARGRGIYDELSTSEITRWLSDRRETFDLIVACDTFIYFGDLTPVLRLVREQLTPGGLVAFSVERAESGDHRLTDNGRYVHHLSHLEEAARGAGLTFCFHRRAFLRMEYGRPVEGLVVCLSRSPVDGTTESQSPKGDLEGPLGFRPSFDASCSGA